MATRRSFIAGMLAAGIVPKPTWADAGSPDFLSAAMKPDGSYVLCGLSNKGAIVFAVPLPDRGHAAAAHPSRPEAVAFARRPGSYAIVLDCRTGQSLTRLEALPGRHFYGHGTFSADGDLLFTTENDYDVAAGIVGIWDTRTGYSRIGEVSSGGIGPHDVRLMPDGKTLVVANGGIETHPDSGRTKLNLPTMRSNLSYLTLDGAIVDHMHLGPEHQRNSIRHLAVSGSGDVAFAMQWQGDMSADLPLLGVHRLDRGQIELCQGTSIGTLQGYIGSIAINDTHNTIAVTSPRAGLMQVVEEGAVIWQMSIADVCGVVTEGTGFLVTAGTGRIQMSAEAYFDYQLSWDNHIIRVN